MKFTGVEATPGGLVWHLVCNLGIHRMIVAKDTPNIDKIRCDKCKPGNLPERYHNETVA